MRRAQVAHRPSPIRAQQIGIAGPQLEIADRDRGIADPPIGITGLCLGVAAQGCGRGVGGSQRQAESVHDPRRNLCGGRVGFIDTHEAPQFLRDIRGVGLSAVVRDDVARLREIDGAHYGRGAGALSQILHR